eukprot:3807041-Prymnesium_polylepis.1
MEVDEKPTEEFNDVGGLDGQIQELVSPLPRPRSSRAHAHRSRRAAPRARTPIARTPTAVAPLPPRYR